MTLLFNLQIECNTPAFEVDPRQEVARILVDAVSQVVTHADNNRGAVLVDANGVQVGTFQFISPASKDK